MGRTSCAGGDPGGSARAPLAASPDEPHCTRRQCVVDIEQVPWAAPHARQVAQPLGGRPAVALRRPARPRQACRGSAHATTRA
eukprot:2139859-Prymnesium_polylepis.1